METENNTNFEKEKWERWANRHHKESRIGRVLAGIIIIGIGSLLLARQAGALLPAWLFTWKMLLVAIGLCIGAKRGFRPSGWLIPIAVGLIFAIDDFAPGINISHLAWPGIIILFGLIMIFKPRRKFCGPHHWRRHRHHWERGEQYAQTPAEEGTGDRVDYTSVFSSIKKNIISKDFKGGEVTCFFGGAELNLTQADINGEVVLESTQVFGGAQYIVPSHWKVKSEITSVFGGVEDKRPIQSESTTDHSKVLILQGTCVFGGIEITSR